MAQDEVGTDERRLSWVWWLAAPLVLLAAYGIAMLTAPQAWVGWLWSEAGPMEWGQAAFFLGAGVVALGVAWGVKGRAPAWVLGFYVVFGLAGLVVTGEELSWGQHLLEFETPETLAELNKQDEANLHNLWDDLPSRLMRRFLEIGLPVLCILVPGVLWWTGKAYGWGTWEWWTLPRLEAAPAVVIAGLGRLFKASDGWGWPVRWHDSASEFAEVFWAYAILLWIVAVALRVGRRNDGDRGAVEIRTS